MGILRSGVLCSMSDLRIPRSEVIKSSYHLVWGWINTPADSHICAAQIGGPSELAILRSGMLTSGILRFWVLYQLGILGSRILGWRSEIPRLGVLKSGFLRSGDPPHPGILWCSDRGSSDLRIVRPGSSGLLCSDLGSSGLGSIPLVRVCIEGLPRLG